jgi:hypothetical protein
MRSGAGFFGNRNSFGNREISLAVIVVGMHRSGTSLVTRLINLMGISVGDPAHLMAPQKDNPGGFWERKDVGWINDGLLVNGGASWEHPEYFDPAFLDGEEASSLRPEAEAVIADLDRDAPWVLKDPRFCLTLPFWLRLLDKPICVFVVRNPFQVARSVSLRNDIGLLSGMRMWERYNRCALWNSRNLPRLFVGFQRLAQDPVGELERLNRFFRDHGMAVEGGIEEAVSYIDADRVNPPAEAHMRWLSDTQRELWEGLRRATAGGEPVECGLPETEVRPDGEVLSGGSLAELKYRYVNQGRAEEKVEQDAARKDLIRRHAREVHELKDAYETQLVEQWREFDSLHRSLEESVRRHSQEIENLKVVYDRQGENDRKRHSAEMTSLKDAYEGQLAEAASAREALRTAMSRELERHSSEVEALKAAYEGQLAKAASTREALRTAMSQELERHSVEMETLKAAYEEQLADCFERHSSEMVALKAAGEGQLANCIERHSSEMAALKAAGEGQLADCIERHSSEMAALKAAYEEQLARADKDLGKARDVLEESFARHSREIQALVDRIGQLEDELRGRDQAVADRDRALADRDRALADRDQALADRDQAVADRDRALADHDQAVADRDRALADRDQAVADRNQVVADRDELIAARDRTLADRDQALAELRGLLEEYGEYASAVSMWLDGRSGNILLRLTRPRPESDAAVALACLTELIEECREKGMVPGPDATDNMIENDETEQ